MLKPGDVVIASFAYADLSGAKTRPALVLSRPEFTLATGLVVVAAISSQPVKNQFEYSIAAWKEAGLFRPSKVCAGKLFSVNAKLVKKIGELAESDFEEALKLFKVVLA